MTALDALLVLLVLVQIGCAATIWHLAGPCAVLLWAAYVWGPAIEAAMLRRRAR